MKKPTIETAAAAIAGFASEQLKDCQKKNEKLAFYSEGLKKILVDIRNELRAPLKPGEYNSLADSIDRRLDFLDIERLTK